MKRFTALVIALAASSGLLAQELKPDQKNALLLGKVTNMQGKVLPGEIVIFESNTDKKQYKAHSDKQGKFELLVPVGTIYNLKYKNFTLDMNYTQMEIPADPDASYEVEVRIDPPREIVLENVLFETGKANLKPSSHKALNDLVEVMRLKSTMVIEIQGHTDNVGSDEANMKLSQERAETVRKYLLGKGVATSRVQSRGYGATRPVADNSTEAGRAKNRRTQLKVISQ